MRDTWTKVEYGKTNYYSIAGDNFLKISQKKLQLSNFGCNSKWMILHWWWKLYSDGDSFIPMVLPNSALTTVMQ